MSRIVTTTIQVPASLKLIPNSFTNTGSYNFTNQTVANAYTDADSTSSNRMTLSRSNQSSRTSTCYYEFDKSGLSSIPSNATITSISANVKYYVSNTTYVTAVSIQLHSNTTAKGSAVTQRPTTGTKYSITAGSWTLAELQNIRLYVSATHNTSNNNAYLYFYGADVTIEYTYPEEVQITEYQISVTNNASGITVSPTGTNNWVAEGGSQTITFTNVSNVNTISIVDNSTNVTNQIVHTSGTTYTYTISNISADHTIVVSNAQTYNVNVSIDSNATDLVSSSNSGNNTAYEGHDFDVDISCDDISIISVYDNNVDVTSEVKELTAVSGSLSFTPSEYDERNSSFASIYDGNTSTPIGQNSNATNRICVYSNKGASAESKLIYKFDCSSIPSNATITNVSCTVKCSCYSSSPGTYFATYTVQLYCGDVAKGSSSNIPGGGSSPSSTPTISGGSWTREELDDICLIERVVRVASGTNATADASFNLWGATLTIQYTTPSGYKYTIENVQAAHNIVLAEAPYNVISGTSNLSGASFSNLPQKFYVSGRDFTVYITGITNDKSFKLYDNNVDVTSSVDLYDYSYTIENITQDHVLRIDEATKHNITGTSSLTGVSFQNVPSTAYDTDDFVAKITGVSDIQAIKLVDNGATVTQNIGYYTGSKTFVPAEYEGGTFTSSNTGNGLYGSNHTANYASFTLSSSSQYGVYDFDISIPSNVIIKSISCTVRAYVTGTASSRFVQLYSGDIAKGVASTIPTSNGTFELECGDWTADELNNAKLRFEGLNSSTYYIYFYGATLTIECDECTYRISNVLNSHNLMISENPKHNVTGSSSFNGVGFSGLANNIYESTNVEIYITGTTNRYSIVLKDNNVDVTSSIDFSSTPFVYRIQNISANHALALSEADHYSVSASSEFNKADISVSPSVLYNGDGFTAEIEVDEGTSPYAVRLYDNNIDVTDDIVIGTMENPSYEVENITTNYGFVLNNDGYYESNNKNATSTAAVCRVTFQLPVQCRITIKYINYAEATYDFGVFSKVDTALSTSAWTSSSSGGDTTTDAGLEEIRLNTNAYNTADVQTLIYTINSGEHFIDIKYATDAGTFSGNDSLQWKIDSIEPLQPILNGILYTLTDVSENHTLLVVEQDKVTITANSTYSGATVSVSPTQIYKKDSFTITVNVSDLSLVSISDNSKMITGKFSGTNPYTYTVNNVKTNHTVLVTQHIDYTVTLTDNATNGDLTQTGTITIEAGYDAMIDVETDYLNRIYLKDNNVIKNNLLEYHEEIPSTSPTCSPSYYEDATNFTESTQYPWSRGYNSSSQTSNYARFQLNANDTTTNCYIFYGFEIADIPEDAIIDSVSVSIRISKNNRTGNSYAQLFNNNAAKGTAQSIISNSTTGTSVTVLNVSGGSWTPQELNDNIRLRIIGVRSATNQGSYIYFWGATLTITYHVDEHYSYTLESISENHTIVLQDRPTYVLTSSSNVSGSTISPASVTIYEDNPAEFTISTSELFRLKLLDNGTNVKNQLTISGNNYIYTIDSVMEAHTLLLDRLLKPALKVNGSWVDYSRIFKKIDGIWVEQITAEGLFENGKIYMLNS